jgi:hypothetical protein
VPIARDVPEAGECAAHSRHDLGTQLRHGQDYHPADDDRDDDRPAVTLVDGFDEHVRRPSILRVPEIRTWSSRCGFVFVNITRAKRPARLRRERASGRHGEGGLKFVSGDPNDARFEVGPGILCRVDLRQHGIHRHGRVPFLDLSQ